MCQDFLCLCSTYAKLFSNFEVAFVGVIFGIGYHLDSLF